LAIASQTTTRRSGFHEPGKKQPTPIDIDSVRQRVKHAIAGVR
jgi:hypothetical protein